MGDRDRPGALQQDPHLTPRAGAVTQVVPAAVPPAPASHNLQIRRYQPVPRRLPGHSCSPGFLSGSGVGDYARRGLLQWSSRTSVRHERRLAAIVGAHREFGGRAERGDHGDRASLGRARGSAQGPLPLKARVELPGPMPMACTARSPAAPLAWGRGRWLQQPLQLCASWCVPFEIFHSSWSRVGDWGRPGALQQAPHVTPRAGVVTQVVAVTVSPAPASNKL